MTYELCGPKVNGNPEGFGRHALVPHGLAPVEDAPRDFHHLAAYMAGFDGEGIVWHPPGRPHGEAEEPRLPVFLVPQFFPGLRPSAADVSAPVG